ncbi:protein of unknown function [Hyphomicrobium sp. MC1]|nr:protein of unknown function [Hyphomicrobium sp. MC1]
MIVYAASLLLSEGTSYSVFAAVPMSVAPPAVRSLVNADERHPETAVPVSPTASVAHPVVVMMHAAIAAVVMVHISAISVVTAAVSVPGIGGHRHRAESKTCC